MMMERKAISGEQLESDDFGCKKVCISVPYGNLSSTEYDLHMESLNLFIWQLEC